MGGESEEKLDCSPFHVHGRFHSFTFAASARSVEEGYASFQRIRFVGQWERVRTHFSLPHVRYAGSHTKCGCGFNEGREYPQVYDDPSKARANAMVSSALLVRYVREHQVEQIYSCWSSDEELPQEFERRITADTLMHENFFFREKELLNIDRRAG